LTNFYVTISMLASRSILSLATKRSRNDKIMILFQMIAAHIQRIRNCICKPVCVLSWSRAERQIFAWSTMFWFSFRK